MSQGAIDRGADDSVVDADTTAAWLGDVLGHSVRITGIIKLTGGLSEAMFRVDLADPELPAVVLRRWPANHDRQRESVRREATALSLLDGSAVGAPWLLASDPLGKWTGRPANLMTLLPGAVELAPTDVEGWIHQLADRLALIHDQPRHPNQEKVLRWVDLEDPDRLRWLDSLPYGGDALALAHSATDPVREVFLHSDYQHFNLLWRQGRLDGVVDWTMSGVGDAGRDVGHCALNLAVLYDAGRAWRFLERYEAVTGTVVDHGWLLCELLDFSAAWPQFIPLQVGGRVSIDTAGMRGRVEDLIVKVLGAAG